MSKDRKVVAFTGRKPIPKRVRFSVFKRDSFTCQYCGAKAPDVLLQVDHIKPVADGGENEIINLITSCAACNGGKGAEPLDENAAIEKQRRQLEELTERRNQLEMMVEWREGLRDLESDYLQAIQNEFLSYGPFTANETGQRDIKRWLKQYQVSEILDAIGKSFTQYLVHGDDGKPTSESWNRAFDMVSRIARSVRRNKDNPSYSRAYYVRGILRKRLSYVDERNILDMVRDAVDEGVDVEDIVDLSRDCRNWTDFNTSLGQMIAKAVEDK